MKVAIGRLFLSISDQKADPLNRSTSTVYDVIGQAIASINPLGHRNRTLKQGLTISTYHGWDARNKMTYTEPPIGRGRRRTKQSTSLNRQYLYDFDLAPCVELNAHR